MEILKISSDIGTQQYLNWQKKESVTLKIECQRLFKLKNREKKEYSKMNIDSEKCGTPLNVLA